MTVKVKRIDMSSLPFSRTVQWNSGLGEFTAGDVINIGDSILKGSTNCTVAVAALSSCTVYINAWYKRYPPYKELLSDGINAPDLQQGKEVINLETVSYTLAAGQTLEVDDMPVTSLYFSALVGTVVVTAR